MLAACEVGEVFALLEGGAGGAREASDVLVALYSSVRDPWLTRALLAYHARTGSARAVDLLARAPDLHARYLLDALQDQLRADRASRQHALAAFAPLVARRPAWLHRLSAHPLAREVARAARSEREPVPLLHALLALAALLPAAPALGAHLAAELADALLRPAPHPLAARAQLALFRALYATHPCTLLEHWRAAGADLPPAPRAAWRRAVAALADRVRLHPALVTGSRQREADPARWARLEAHDVLDESRRLDVRVCRDPTPEPTLAAAPATEPPRVDAAPGSGAFAARALSALRPGGEQWFALAERCAADSAPPTPLPVDVDASEPPEAAVEATPENTPARETRAQFRFPADSGAVRAIGRRSRPASPPRKETSPSWASGGAGEAYSSRLARVALDRRAADSPVPFAGAPPPPGAAVARPEPNRPPAPAEAGEPLNLEDREVLELTARAPAECEWAEWPSSTPGRDSVRPRDPRDSEPALGLRRSVPGPRRAASCSPRLPGVRRSSVAVQTVDTWPEPYEFMIADLFRSLPDDLPPQSETHRPCEKLDEYMADLYAGRPGSGNNGSSDLAEQLELAHAQLMYERWRREAHAERNRRLLGRCRQTRALELQNAALQERIRGLQLERDELRCRLQKEPPPPPPAAPPGLEDALAEEKAARFQAEASLKECLAQREVDAAELQRARGDSFEAARHVEALARAAMVAERRAEHIRRLRRELLILAERDQRLTEAVRAGTLAAESAANNERAQQDDRALRAAWARAEAEAEASAAKAEAASARAHELEATLAARDATIAELKRATRLAAEEGAAQLRALRDKYSALLRVVRAKEAHQLDRLAAPAPGPRQPRDAPTAATAGRS